MKTTENGQTTAYQANASNQYTQLEMSGQVFEPEYDKNGNLLKDPSRTYTWDADIHLLSVTTRGAASNTAVPAVGVPGVPPGTRNNDTQSVNGEPGQRPATQSGETPDLQGEATFFVLDGWNFIAEYAASIPNHRSTTAAPSLTHAQPAPAARHLWGEDLSRSLQGAGGIGGLLASTHFPQPSPTTANNSKPPQTSPQTHFLSYDSNGNVMLLTDATCIPTASYRYDSFGRVTKAGGPAAALNRYQFSTKPIDVGSGFAYYGYRYYSPELGRWPNRDPIEEAGGINLLGMGNNSPINQIDVLGAWIGQVLALCGAIIVGAIWIRCEWSVDNFEARCNEAEQAGRAYCDAQGGTYTPGPNQSYTCALISRELACGGGSCRSTTGEDITLPPSSLPPTTPATQ